MNLRTKLRTAPSLVLRVAMLLGAVQLGAQERPVSFLHGFGSSPETWSTMIPALETELFIRTMSPRMVWPNSYLGQAVAFADSVQQELPSSLIGVGHSNGGMVTRTHVIESASPRVNSILTINSPHQGARLAWSALEGYVATYFGAPLSTFGLAWQYYYYDQQPWYHWKNLVDQVVGVLQLVGNYFTAVGFAAPYLFQQTHSGLAPEVLYDMSPGSARLNTLNSSQAIEAQRAPTRVSISSAQEAEGQPWSNALESPGPAVAQSLVLAVFFYSYNAYADYASSYDPYLQAGAHLWLLAADQLICLEANWHVLIGAYNSPTNVGCLAYPTIANDGVVTWQSSAYPSGIFTTMSPGTFGNITHMRQTTNPDVKARVSQIMRDNMGVLERVPPLSAGIVGGTEGSYGLECTFSASVGGGRPPFSYQWFVNGNLVGTASTYAHTFTGAATLNLFVTDADSSAASAQAALTVDPIGFGSC